MITLEHIRKSKKLPEYTVDCGHLLAPIPENAFEIGTNLTDLLLPLSLLALNMLAWAIRRRFFPHSLSPTRRDITRLEKDIAQLNGRVAALEVGKEGANNPAEPI